MLPNVAEPIVFGFSPSYAAIPKAILGSTPIEEALFTIYCATSLTAGLPAAPAAAGVPAPGAVITPGLVAPPVGAPVVGVVPVCGAGAPGNGDTPERSIETDPPSPAAIEKCIASFDERQFPPQPNPYLAAISPTLDGISVTRRPSNKCGLVDGLMSIATPSE